MPDSPQHFHTHILPPTFCSVPMQEEWNLKANFLYLYYAINQKLLGKNDIFIAISAKIQRIE